MFLQQPKATLTHDGEAGQLGPLLWDAAGQLVANQDNLQLKSGEKQHVHRMFRQTGACALHPANCCHRLQSASCQLARGRHATCHRYNPATTARTDCMEGSGQGGSGPVRLVLSISR